MTALFLSLLLLFASLCCSISPVAPIVPIETAPPSPSPTALPTNEPIAYDRDFASDRLWVVIKNEYHDHLFTCEDFPEIDCYPPENDIRYSREQALTCPSYSIFLRDETKDSVLKACELLMQRDEVAFASPEFLAEDYSGSDFAAFEVGVKIRKDYLDHIYTEDDFSELECRQVRNGRAHMEGFSEKEISEYPFYTIVLPLHSQDAVLDACKLLEQREDIEKAYPNYYGKLFAVPNDTE